MTGRPALAIGEAAALSGFSRRTIVRMFEREPGVIVLRRPETMHKRRYYSIRIPRHVFEREPIIAGTVQRPLKEHIAHLEAKIVLLQKELRTGDLTPYQREDRELALANAQEALSALEMRAFSSDGIGPGRFPLAASNMHGNDAILPAMRTTQRCSPLASPLP